MVLNKGDNMKYENLDLEKLLRLAIQLSYEAKKPPRTMVFLYSLLKNIEEGETHLIKGRQRQSVENILDESLNILNKREENG